MGAILVIGFAPQANKDGRRAYQDMLLSVKLQHLVRWTEASVDSIDALLMPDGQYSVILYECRTTALTWVLERIG
ncbi:hypothetical protein JK2ML_1445 [Mycobacterium leprae Kyoto-2]|uniref:Uncharacterized protein n=3 Tax=Mycobacterium leprae TaxID=1769 RepID=Q9CC03_MYCLE|nr:hypothetical protein [Mycobacterium leprae]CAR71539.1 hypothetical protein MLBr01445 [Mycobacterium leprae Br4923]AWV48014.1 hypothetical protein DIJ64_07895 [Mycobacterium leprae]OAR19784.1 hypothetical protein A8144_03790 [Mycobacterium leprae 3125609]OAX71898.1 hypothetical protein A3216_02830 [Mycobacterium leprae 7935681]CAC30395.1 hypothetical protein [Mycobacterium leprae]